MICYQIISQIGGGISGGVLSYVVKTYFLTGITTCGMYWPSFTR